MKTARPGAWKALRRAVFVAWGVAVATVRGTGQTTTVDPQAFVAHVGQVNADISMNAGWRDAVGRGAGEGIQLKITGTGTVYVQASEQKIR